VVASNPPGTRGKEVSGVPPYINLKPGLARGGGQLCHLKIEKRSGGMGRACLLFAGDWRRGEKRHPAWEGSKKGTRQKGGGKNVIPC